MNRFVPIAVGLALMIVVTVVQGWWSERWGTPVSEEELRDWSGRMDNVPLEIGNWQGKVMETDEEQLKASKAAASISREYTDSETKRSVHVMLMCGTSRNVAIHTPDKCYVAAGYSLLQQPQQFTVDTKPVAGQFFTAPFSKEEIATGLSRLRIFWSWNAEGKWIAPGAPAYAKVPLSRHRILYKLYVITTVPSTSEKAEENKCQDFIELLLPTLNEKLFPKAPAVPAVAHSRRPA